jgi:ATP-dependent NAD(P)H-hydrate dehydratase
MLYFLLILILLFTFDVVTSVNSDMINLTRSFIPKFLSSARKGSHGKVAIIGGSFEYTGAPYYAALSSLRTGADLVWIFCAEEAAIPIKSYSPEFIVLPILPSLPRARLADPSSLSRDKERVNFAIFEFERLAPRFDSVVFGPGLGRDELTYETLRGILDVCKKRFIPAVIDGDALFYLSTNADALSLITSGNWPVVLTPNAMEFKRLWALVCPHEEIGSRRNEEAVEHFVKSLGLNSKTSGGMVTVLLKGELDVVASDGVLETIPLIGSPRRCGGQGDILAGSVGTFLAWANAEGLLGMTSNQRTKITVDNGESAYYINQILSSCAVGGSLVTRNAALLAFSKKRRATTTPDILNEIGEAFERAFPDC